tara:strand:+ start:689 stop:1423 length:735 start_codon:yes stop_codon:yes gene_type:complete
MVQRNVSHTIVLKDCLQQCLQDAKVNSTQDKGNADKDNSNNEVKEEFTVTGNCKSNNNVLINEQNIGDIYTNYGDCPDQNYTMKQELLAYLDIPDKRSFEVDYIKERHEFELDKPNEVKPSPGILDDSPPPPARPWTLSAKPVRSTPNNLPTNTSDFGPFYKIEKDEAFPASWPSKMTRKTKTIMKPELLDKQTDKHIYLNEDKDGLSPDQWKYSDESIMNGATIYNDVHAYDGDYSQFAALKL